MRGRTFLPLALLGLLFGCAPAKHDTSRLEAAVERFERAAAQAEAAAAQAEASARKAEIAAQAATPPPHLQLRGTESYRRCSEAGRGPVKSRAQAAGTAQRFLTCLDISWGTPREVVRVDREQREADLYRVEYGPEPGMSDWHRTVLVDSNGDAEFPSR